MKVVMKIITNINGIPTKTTANTSLNICKGVPYVYSYNLEDFPAFRSDLMSQNELIDVIEPHLLKSNQNNRAKPLLLIFSNYEKFHCSRYHLLQVLDLRIVYYCAGSSEE